MSSSESVVVVSVSVFEFVVLAEDDAEFVVITVLVFVVVDCDVWISSDIVSVVIVLLSASVALADVINKMVAHIKIIVPK